MRRRIAVLVGLLAVVAVIVLIIVRPGAGAESKPADNGNTSAVQPENENAGGGSAEPAACKPGSLKVTPITDSNTYDAGELPQLSLAVVNTGKEECVADLGTATMVFKITSGSDEIWSSTDCQSDPVSHEVIMKPGEPLDTESVAWDRTRSTPETCDADRPEVGAGGASYHLNVEIAGAKGEETKQFMLY